MGGWNPFKSKSNKSVEYLDTSPYTHKKCLLRYILFVTEKNEFLSITLKLLRGDPEDFAGAAEGKGKL